jgi:hypothetical protein
MLKPPELTAEAGMPFHQNSFRFDCDGIDHYPPTALEAVQAGGDQTWLGNSAADEYCSGA